MFEVVRTAQKQLHSPHSRHPYYIQMMKTSASSTNSISPPPRIPEHITYSYKTVFKVYFNFTFFMCISPFRFSQITSTWDKSVTYRLKKFSPQMFLCGIVHLLIIYNYLVSIRSVNFTKLAQNPVVYFELFQTVTNSFYRIAFCIMLWSKQEKVVKVMEFSGDLAAPSDKVVQRIYPFTIFLCVMYTSMALACGTLGDEYASHAMTNDGSGAASSSSRWTPTSFLMASSAKAKYSLFLSTSVLPNAKNKNDTIPGTTTTDMNIGDVLFGIVGMAMSIARNLCTFHSNLFLLLMTLSLASHVKALYSLITPPQEASSTPKMRHLQANLPVQVVLSKYKGLKELSNLFNATFGHLMLLYVLTSIATIATYLDSVIVEPDLFTKIRIVWSTNTFIIILTVGSNICNQISELKTWLSKEDNCQQLPLSHLVILLNELNDNPVGVSGMGLFTIHYKFVTGLVSTLVTYFIIMLQFQVAAREVQD